MTNLLDSEKKLQAVVAEYPEIVYDFFVQPVYKKVIR